jgi:hypothetical protein
MTRMSRVYEPEAFASRVAFAATVIAAGRNTTRNFDTCFEMSDGDEVAAALVRRAKANPTGNLAKNLFRYIGKELALESYDATAQLSTRQLAEKAAESRARRSRVVS